MSKAYADTSVAVSRSQEQIRARLVATGARGVQFTEDWMAGTIGFRFVKMKKHDDTEFPLMVNMTIHVWPNAKKRLYASPREKEQRERQVWRALYWYLKSQFEAVDFGLRTLEDVFMSDIQMQDGRTIGDHVRGALALGRLALPAGVGESLTTTLSTPAETTP